MFPEVFMKIQLRIVSIVSSVWMAGLLITQPLQAQQSSPQSTQQPATAQPQQPAQPNSVPADQATPAEPSAAPTTQNQPSQPQQTPPSGTTVNPSQAPLQPVTTYPDASGTQQQEPQSTPAQQTTV